MAGIDKAYAAKFFTPLLSNYCSAIYNLLINPNAKIPPPAKLRKFDNVSIDIYSKGKVSKFAIRLISDDPDVLSTRAEYEFSIGSNGCFLIHLKGSGSDYDVLDRLLVANGSLVTIIIKYLDAAVDLGDIENVFISMSVAKSVVSISGTAGKAEIDLPVVGFSLKTRLLDKQ